jgi:hypothetical protein
MRAGAEGEAGGMSVAVRTCVAAVVCALHEQLAVLSHAVVSRFAQDLYRIGGLFYCLHAHNVRTRHLRSLPALVPQGLLLAISLSLSLSVCLSVCPSVCLSLSLYFSMFLSIDLFIYLSIYLSIPYSYAPL